MCVVGRPTRGRRACLFVSGRPPPRPYWGRSARPVRPVRPGRPVPLDLTHGPPRPVRPVPSLGPTGAVSRPARAVSPPLGPSIRAVIRYLPAPENAAFGKYGGRPVRLSYVRPSPVPSRAFRLSRSGPRSPCLYVVGRLPSVRGCFGAFAVSFNKSLCRYCLPAILPHRGLYSPRSTISNFYLYMYNHY